MKKLGLLSLLFFAFSCSSDNEDSKKEVDEAALEKMYTEIITLSLANTQSCTDSKDWDFTAIGAKACGGPEKFIIYSKKINTVDFLAKVKAYTDARAAFNVKWNIYSTCNVPVPPDGIGCVDGKPVFLKNTTF
ncbi:hypothetical protein [Flavobacterium hungaricum]|uniref:Lipoprotein n=1 Tax=Flavobacterium hungaricum TaxID=2082725 RepID=A0ABR9TF64_9FLAO|nr:hypothetical protein [Flavobacterium hungaricum]MBE8723921.1 hypothetical protein [Flavobacterium hungaricum]